MKLFTTINETEYYVNLFERPCGKKDFWIRQIRIVEGKKIAAFLSSRQHKIESRVRSIFSKEITAHMKKVA